MSNLIDQSNLILEDREWELLLRRIRDGKCTPFLGAGACYGILPLGSDIARAWAKEYDYPMDDVYDLPRVAQYLSVQYDSMYPKEELIKDYFSGEKIPNFKDPDEPHGILADLPLPVYLTTNYDNFMVKALESAGKKPVREYCRWNEAIKFNPSIFENAGYEPDPHNPVVFHLHGLDKVPESLVLTDDDYLDYLINISRDQNVLPHLIQRAMAGSSLLFIGYSLEDWTFRVLFRGLVNATESALRRISVAVQLPPDAPESTQRLIQKYRNMYFDKIDIRIHWGTARNFVEELRARWKTFSANG
ncbi:MAG: SIR2 family protein [Rhodothermales bacterium]